MPSIFAWIVRVGHALAATWRRWFQVYHALAACLARCDWLPSIFAWIVRVGHALAATWRGAAHRRWQQQQQQMAPGVPRARCLFGAVHGLGGGALLHGLGGGTLLNGLGGGTLLNGLGGGASLLQQATRSWRSWSPAKTPRSLSSILAPPTLHGSERFAMRPICCMTVQRIDAGSCDDCVCCDRRGCVGVGRRETRPSELTRQQRMGIINNGSEWMNTCM